MIMNRFPGGSGKLFSTVSTITLGTAFVPKSLNVVNGVWLIGGNVSASSSHPVLAQSNDTQTYTITEFTNRAVDVRGVGFTNNGYVIFANYNAYSAMYVNKAIGALANGTDSTAITRASGGTYGTDIVVDGNAVYICGYYNATYPALNMYAAAMPTFASTGSDGAVSYTINAALVGSRPIAITASGGVVAKSSVGAQYNSVAKTIETSTAGITTQKVAYCNGYAVIGGKKSDGTYIWYSPASSLSSWTPQKISNTANDVFGIIALKNKVVVLYVTSNGDIQFWASKTNDITKTSVSDYADDRFSSISSDTIVTMKDNGNNTALLVSYSGTTVHATKIQ